ncbi:pilus assembly protein TadG-related protein [Fictibacillus sp. JL2B1089]|uniref:pilus assembly protein TadG-related protein n=1 Tax=Fictibacillus sp. JL2B1089 TaxID=3399565 RepID=UPI003A8820D0
MNSNYLKSEKGSTLLVVMGLLMAAIFISFIFFDFFTTFAAKRVGQTSADAAALAAAEEAKQIYDKELKEQIKERLDKLKEEQAEEEEEESKGDEPQEDEGISTPLPEIGDVLFGKEMPPGVEKWINGSIVDLDSLNLNEALKYLFEQDEINKISCGSIDDAFPKIEEAARHYAKLNGAEDDIEVEFPYEGEFKVYVKVKKKAEFVTVDENMFSGDENMVRAEAAVNIATPKGLEISCD